MRLFAVIFLCMTFCSYAQDSSYSKKFRASFSMFFAKTALQGEENGLTKRYAQPQGDIDSGTIGNTEETSYGFSLGIERAFYKKWYAGINFQVSMVEDFAVQYYEQDNWDLAYDYNYRAYYFYTGLYLTRDHYLFKNSKRKSLVYLNSQIGLGLRGTMSESGEMREYRRYNWSNSYFHQETYSIHKNAEGAGKLYVDLNYQLTFNVYSVFAGLGLQNFSKNYYEYRSNQNGTPIDYSGLTKTLQYRFILGYKI